MEEKNGSGKGKSIENLCIIGQEKNETDLRLLEEAKKRFEKVFFVPIEGIDIGLDNGFSIEYRVSDLLKFNAVLPRIPVKHYNFAYQLLSLFPETAYMPIKPISFLLSSERFFLLTVLKKRGINTLNLHLTRSPKAATKVLESLKFPVIVRVPEKKTGVIAGNLTEAKSVVEALGSLDKHILIEDVIKDMVSVYVADPDVLGAVKRKTKERDLVFAKGNLKKQKIGLDIKQLALDAAKAVEAQIARVDISLNGEPKVVGLDLTPNLAEAEKVLGNEIISKTLESVYENYKAYRQKPIFMKFFDDAKSVVKDALGTKHLL